MPENIGNKRAAKSGSTGSMLAPSGLLMMPILRYIDDEWAFAQTGFLSGFHLFQSYKQTLVGNLNETLCVDLTPPINVG